jgi:hypothetical protein
MPDSLTSQCGLEYSNITCPQPGEPGWGQDSSYTLNWPDYETTDEIVRDNRTGLVWERNPPTGAVTWEEARSYCESLSLGGYTNWRLPRAVEVVSIMDAGNPDHLLNQVVFPSQVYRTLWTASSFSHGVYIRAPMAGGSFAWDDLQVRCVRTDLDPAFETRLTGLGGLEDVGRSAGAPSQQYSIQADVVVDKVTGLTWQRASPDTTYSWTDALAYCESLELAGASDWRLPSFKELWTIIDERAEDLGPAIDRTAFPDPRGGVFWSSTFNSPEPTFNPPGGLLIDFHDGSPVSSVSDPSGQVQEFYVRCAR